MEEFLRTTGVIDWNHPSVYSQAQSLSRGTADVVEIAKRSFEWVRDNIQHSIDFRRNPVTCSASEVLAAGTGFCYAKSHLLAALLRANGIPAGFCYQRFIGDREQSYIVHGLNAINLPGLGWYRVDARGNKAGVNAQFAPPVEQLAFHVASPGERLFPQVLPDPLDVVVAALRKYSDWLELWDNLPDWPYPSLPAPGIELQSLVR